MNARAIILQRLRSAPAQLPHVDATVPAPAPSVTREESIARFLIEAAALGVRCFVEPTAGDVQRRLAELVNGKRVLSWADELLPYGAASVLRNVTYPLESSILPTSATRLTRLEQAAADLGITGCDAAVAETGSLVLFSGPGKSRAVSLLPPVHLALLESHRLHFTMAEMFAAHAKRLAESAACTVITGPSRTADIELTLTLGIHGPAEVIVILGP